MHKLPNQTAQDWEKDVAIELYGLIAKKMFSSTKYEMLKMYVYEYHKGLTKKMQPLKLWKMHQL